MTKITITFILAIFINHTNGFCTDIKDLFPKNNELKNCKVSEPIRVFKGDELYTYIDGGAEIFMEYGFRQVSTTNYSDINKNQLQVEIYEMNDSDAAYGAYTFYLNGEGKPYNAGTEGVFIDYYAVFWKGNFMTVISATEYKDAMEPVIKELSSGITTKISSISQPPSMITSFKKSGLATGYIKYLKGNVGLSNVYRFIPGNSFAFNEGVSFNISETQIIVMKFESEKTAVLRLSEALSKMKAANNETAFTDIEKGFSFSDYKSNKVNCVNIENYIIIIIGNSEEKFSRYLEEIKKAVK